MTLPSVVAGRAGGLLADEAALRTWVMSYGASYGTGQRAVASALAFKSYTWVLIDAAVSRWVAERRVVDVSESYVVVRGPGDGEPGLAFVEERLTVLPDDPLAGQPGVDVVADEAALLEVLRVTLVEGHLVAAVEAFRKLRGGGSRPLWGTVAQSIAYPAATCDSVLVPDRVEAIGQLLTILPPGVADLVEIAEIDEGDGWRPLLLRRTCCYAHTLPGCSPCLTCCLLDDAGRDAAAEQEDARWRRP